jgi:hypothetical protein
MIREIALLNPMTVAASWQEVAALLARGVLRYWLRQAKNLVSPLAFVAEKSDSFIESSSAGENTCKC